MTYADENDFQEFLTSKYGSLWGSWSSASSDENESLKERAERMAVIDQFRKPEIDRESKRIEKLLAENETDEEEAKEDDAIEDEYFCNKSYRSSSLYKRRRQAAADETDGKHQEDQDQDEDEEEVEVQRRENKKRARKAHGKVMTGRMRRTRTRVNRVRRRRTRTWRRRRRMW
jgi:hypothetical protein